MLQLESMVVSMIIRIWLRALALHYPSHPYWQGLQELCLASRHRIGQNYVWSRVMVVFTFNLVRPHIIQGLSAPCINRLPGSGDKVSALVETPPLTGKSYCLI